jgi:hypothetical protein
MRLGCSLNNISAEMGVLTGRPRSFLNIVAYARVYWITKKLVQLNGSWPTVPEIHENSPISALKGDIKADIGVLTGQPRSF